MRDIVFEERLFHNTWYGNSSQMFLPPFWKSRETERPNWISARVSFEVPNITVTLRLPRILLPFPPSWEFCIFSVYFCPVWEKWKPLPGGYSLPCTSWLLWPNEQSVSVPPQPPPRSVLKLLRQARGEVVFCVKEWVLHAFHSNIVYFLFGLGILKLNPSIPMFTQD